MAIGARRYQAAWAVLRDVTGFVAAGVFAGLGVSLALGRLVRICSAMCPPNDPTALAGAAVAMLAD